MEEVEVLTGRGQLALASEFRFDYWHTDAEHRYYTVKRGRGRLDGKWCILDGVELDMCIWAYWDGTCWNPEIRGEDAYRYELEEALVITKKLAFEENQRVIDVMERRFGEFRGGRYDMAVRGRDDDE